MGKDRENRERVGDRRKDGPAYLCRFDVERFGEKYGIHGKGGTYIVWIDVGVSAIEVVSAMRKAGIARANSGQAIERDAGAALMKMADQVQEQVVRGGSGDV